jgi:hypothetical protein
MQCPHCGEHISPKNRKPLSIKRLRELLDFDLHTGVPTWRTGRYAGKVAGYVSGSGYRVVRIDGQGHYAHRLHWAHFHGRHPRKGYRIDHINNSPGDNGIQNLREASPQRNAANAKRRSWRKHKGVHRTKSGSFVATIGVRGRTRYLGSFKRESEAARAYLKAAQKHFGTASRI